MLIPLGILRLEICFLIAAQGLNDYLRKNKVWKKAGREFL
jgi:hypothetical protein